MHVFSPATPCFHPPDNFFVSGNMDGGSRTHQLRRQLQFNRTRTGGVIDFGFYQKSLSLMQRRPTKITVQLDDQKSNRQDRNQKRRERQPQIAAGSAKNSVIRANHHWKLVLEKADGKQVRFQPIFGSADRFLIRGVAKYNHHQRPDHNRNGQNEQERTRGKQDGAKEPAERYERESDH